MTSTSGGQPASGAQSGPSGGPGATGGGAGSPEAFGAADQEALKHAWDWFSLHSGQRMQMLSFFFVAVGLIIAAYGTLLNAGRIVAAVGLAIAGLVLTVAFALADLRTKNLVKAVEGPLATLQERLGRAAALTDLDLVIRVERAKPRLSSYSNVVRLLLVTLGALFIAGTVYAAAPSQHDEPVYRPEGHHFTQRPQKR